MIAQPFLLIVLVVIGIAAGWLDTRRAPTRGFTGLITAVAFGLGFVLTRKAFRLSLIGFPVIGLGASMVGGRWRWGGILTAVAGVGVVTFVLGNEVSPAVTVPGFAVLLIVGSGSRAETGRALGPLVAFSLICSQLGLYVAVPDTEAAVASGGVAIGLAIAAVLFKSESPTITAVSVIMLTAMLGSARSTETLLGTSPVLGVFAVLAMPSIGVRLEARLVADRRKQMVAAIVHLAACSLPRWLIVGHV